VVQTADVGSKQESTATRQCSRVVHVATCVVLVSVAAVGRLGLGLDLGPPSPSQHVQREQHAHERSTSSTLLTHRWWRLLRGPGGREPAMRAEYWTARMPSRSPRAWNDARDVVTVHVCMYVCMYVCMCERT
jgi:hypothetical protein